MRAGLSLLAAIALALTPALLAPSWAQADEGAPAADTDDLGPPVLGSAAVARSAAADPASADRIVALAVARDPGAAGDIVGAAIAALSARGADAAPRIAAAAAATAPLSAAEIAADAATAAALAAGGAARPERGASPTEAVQAALTAAATAAASVTQAVITAVAQSPDAGVSAGVAAAITRRAVVAAVNATAKLAAQAATQAGASPRQAATLGSQAARLAATTVTQAAIAAATAAVRQAATVDATDAAARSGASPDSVAQSSATAAAAVADGVTRAAVVGSVAVAGSAPIAMASAVTDAAVAQTRIAVSDAASAAASDAGASPEDSKRIAAAAAARAATSVGQAAAQATLAAAPDVSVDDAAAAAGRVDAIAAKAQQPAALPPSPATASRAAFSREGAGILDDPTRLIPLVFALLAFLTVVGLALPWLQPDIFASRLKIITERRGELSQQRKQRLAMERPSLRRAMSSGRVDFMRAVLEKLNLKNIAEQPELKKKLVRAGKRSPQALITFTFLRLALPLALGGFSALVLFGSSNVPIAAAFRLLICMGGVLIGYLLPGIMVSNAIAKRQREIQKKFPDALDLMVICIESGISLEAAFARVSEEMAADAPALAEEVALTVAELSFLADRRQALENLAMRTNTPSVKSLVTSLIQSEKYGTPLGTALRVVSQESREARMARAEEKAASLPAKLTVPMVTFFLPVLFLVLIGPTIIQVMKAFSG